MTKTGWAITGGFAMMALSVSYVLWKWGTWQDLGRKVSNGFWFVWVYAALVWRVVFTRR
jgi:hypothetical protein